MNRFLMVGALVVALLAFASAPAEAQSGGGCGQACDVQQVWCQWAGAGDYCVQGYLGQDPHCTGFILFCLEDNMLSEVYDEAHRSVRLDRQTGGNPTGGGPHVMVG